MGLCVFSVCLDFSSLRSWSQRAASSWGVSVPASLEEGKKNEHGSHLGMAAPSSSEQRSAWA